MPLRDELRSAIVGRRRGRDDPGARRPARDSLSFAGRGVPNERGRNPRV